MRLLTPLLMLAAVSCSGDGASPTDTQPTSDTDTVTSPSAPFAVLSASCEQTPLNALRITCAVETTGPGVTAVDLSADGAPSRTFAGQADGTSVELFGWGLKPDTTYQWQIGDLTGEVSTGPLPDTLATMDIETTGTYSTFDAILQPAVCDETYLIMVDPDGDIIWYQQNNLYQMGMNAYEWSQADRSILVAKQDTFQEVHVSGPAVLELKRGTHFDSAHNLHHDMTRWGDLTFLLFDYVTQDVAVDGIHVFQGEQLLDTFTLEDHYSLESGGGGVGPGGMDWSHANGLNATEDGQLILSLLLFNSALSIDGDPDSPTFLDILWVAAGDTDTLPDPTYLPADGPDEGFSRQHNASVNAEGLWVYDNVGSGAGSRAALYALDDATAEVRLLEAYDTGEFCPIQGGAVPYEGGVLTTCTSSGWIRGYDRGTSAPSFTLRANCGGAAGNLGPSLNRGIPVIVE